MGTQLIPPHSLPQFLAHVCCGKTAGWTKMPLRMEVGLGPGRIVLDGVRPRSTQGPQVKKINKPRNDISIKLREVAEENRKVRQEY